MLNSKLSILCFNHVYSFYHILPSYHATESVSGSSQNPTPAWCTTLWSFISSVVSSVKEYISDNFSQFFSSFWYKFDIWNLITVHGCRLRPFHVFAFVVFFFKRKRKTEKKTQKGENGNENSNWDYLSLVPSRFRFAKIRRQNKRIRRP